MRLSLAFTVPSLLVACGGDDTTTMADAAENGFVPPGVTLKANMEVSADVWQEIGPADLSCLGTPSSDPATTQDITLTTKVTDFQSGNAVPGTMVTAFPGITYMSPFAGTPVTADSMAMVSIVIPTGTKRYGFQMVNTTSALPTFLLNQIVDPANVTNRMTMDPSKIQSVSKVTAATLNALIGQTRIEGTGVVAGALRDCQKHEISGFIATVSSTPATATSIPGGEAYYFDAAVGLPVRHNQQAYASADGLYMIIQLPATNPKGYVQMWGFPTDADLAKGMTGLKLISELEVPILGDNVITGSYEPLRL